MAKSTGKKKDTQELSNELLRELTKDPKYKAFKDDEELAKEIGTSLQNARKRKKLSAAELGTRIGKSEKVILRMEKGEYKQYTMKLLLQLARETASRLKIIFEEESRSSP